MVFFCRILSPFIILSHFSSLQLPIFIYVLLVYNNNCCWNNAAPNSQNTHNTNGVTFKLFFFCILFICYVSILFPIFFTVIFTTPTPNFVVGYITKHCNIHMFLSVFLLYVCLIFNRVGFFLSLDHSIWSLDFHKYPEKHSQFLYCCLVNWKTG